MTLFRVRANDYILNRAVEYRKLMQTGNMEAAVSWMNTQAKDFNRYILRYWWGA